MGTKPLWEQLQALQCHFTWCQKVKDKVNLGHLLKTLAVKMEHTACHNRSIYLALRAYLQHQQGSCTEALGSLHEAETVLRQEHPTNFSRHALLTYGNYAWIYYHLVNYEMVELYLGRIREICQSLSSPEPFSAQIPEVHAQKGWSLLALGFRNGEEAKECFQTALNGDKSNKDFQEGLAISVYASWTHSWRTDLWKEAKSLMEQVLCSQPQNYEVKVYLATLLEKEDWWRSKALTMEVVKGSLNAEELRNAAKLCRKNFMSKAISILQQAIGLAPSYHLLHYDLGICYKQQLEEPSLEGKDEIVAAAIEIFQRAVEEDPSSVFSRLELAQMYGEKTPLYAEELYQNLLEELPKVSETCQQAIYLHWGDFLLHKKGLRQEALERYKAGYFILGSNSKMWKLLGGRLVNLAKMFEGDSEMKQAEAVFEILRLRPNFK